MSRCLYEPFVKGRRCKNERDPDRGDEYCTDCGHLVDLMRSIRPKPEGETP